MGNKPSTNKLRKIRNLCNEFAQNLKYKPIDSNIDAARVRSFISAIMEVLIHDKFDESKVDRPITGTREYWDEINLKEKMAIQSSDEQRQMNLDALTKIKGKLNND